MYFCHFGVVAIVKSLHVVSHYCVFEASKSRHRLCAETERPQIFCNTCFVIYWNMQTRNISVLTPANHIAVDVWVQRGNSALRQIRCTILTLDIVSGTPNDNQFHMRTLYSRLQPHGHLVYRCLPEYIVQYS